MTPIASGLQIATKRLTTENSNKDLVENSYISGFPVLFKSTPDSFAFKNMSFSFGTTFKIKRYPRKEKETLARIAGNIFLQAAVTL